MRHSRWDISEADRASLVSRLADIIADPNSKPREVIAAAKALIAAEGQNQKDEHEETDAIRRKILELAAEHGLGLITKNGQPERNSVEAIGHDGDEERT